MKETTKRERVRMAFRHEEPDRVPWELELSEPTLAGLAEWYKEPRLFQEEFRYHWLGNHCKYLEPSQGDLFHGLVEEVEPGYWRDGWGTQNMGLLMGPKHWRRFFKPRLARMFSRVREAGKLVYLHSDGAISEIFPDLIEIGLDIYNPLQPEIIDIYSIKKEFGERLSFHGGIGVQKLLPYETPVEISKTVEETKKRLGEGGGYLLSQAHPDGILGDTPTENVVALLESLDR
jgi:hypothetical protein